MNEIIDFIVRHWELSAAFVVVLIAYLVFELQQRSGGREVSVEQTVQMFNHQQGVLLDIRDSAAFHAEHISGAINIEHAEVESKIKQLHKYIQKPIIVICNTGRDAGKTVKFLQANGFEQAYALTGGIAAWRTANLPLLKSAAANKSKTKLLEKGS